MRNNVSQMWKPLYKVNEIVYRFMFKFIFNAYFLNFQIFLDAFEKESFTVEM